MTAKTRLLKSFFIIALVAASLGAWQSAAAQDKININSAGIEELTELKGIGPSIAKRIVDYRDEIGSFTSVEQLLEVRGIGPKTLESIAAKIDLSPSSG
jgi:competence protein ComEA